MGNDEKEKEEKEQTADNKQNNEVVVRGQLSPHTDNIQLQQQQHGDGKKVHFASTCHESEAKKPRLVRKRGSGDDNLENDFRTAERGKGSRAGPRKRSYSFSDIKHQPQTIKRWKVGRGGGGGGRGARGGVNVLPSKFLLGGNIHDPLNLNSLSDEKAAELMNAVTPESSPLATPKHRKLEYKIEVLIPPNISDPLNLNAQDDSDYESKLVSPMSKKKKVRHRKRPKKAFPALDLAKLPGPVPLAKTVADAAGSPKIPAGVSKITAGNSKTEAVPPRTPSASKETTVAAPTETLAVKDSPEKDKEKDQSRPIKAKTKEEQTEIQTILQSIPVQSKNKARFQHGNYNQYYGYRNPGQTDDLRLKYFKTEWFTSKHVLDIGCNIGHITITVGKTFGPSRIVGLDIDNKLINVARKNIRHYMDTRPDKKTRYPRAKNDRRMFGRQFGTLNPLGVDKKGDKIKEFPHNVEFYSGNFVPETDALLETVQPEFETILCLSTTKWMHLNHGDDGLKRAFRKMHALLKQGGILVLEAQGFSNYGKRKKLSDAIYDNYKNIKLRPENFPDFLLHDVGFARCDVIALPSHPSKGFQRPLQVFTKLGGSGEVSNSTTPLSFGISPHSYNPAFTPFYGKFTPGSAGYTPRNSEASNEGLTPKSLGGTTQEPIRWSPGGTNQEAATNPEFLYPGPSHLYSGPTPGGYSANSTPSGSYTPGYPGNTPQGGYSANSTPSHTPTQYPSSSSTTLPIVYTGPSSAFSTPGNALSSPLYGRMSGGRSPATDEGGGGVTSTHAPNNTPAPLPPSPSPPSLSSADQTPSYTPRYTPSYTPAHSHSQGSTPVYTGQVNSPGPLSPGAPSPGPSSPGAPSSPLYSPGNATPLVSYSPSQYSPDTVGPGYSPSGPGYSPSAPYSPHSPGYSPSSAGFSMSSPGSYQAPSYSPGPQYSPGNATPIPTMSPRNPFFSPAPDISPLPSPHPDISPAPSPSIQGAEVSGNTTPHPGVSDSPLSTSPCPRYSWSGGNPSGRNTPVTTDENPQKSSNISRLVKPSPAQAASSGSPAELSPAVVIGASPSTVELSPAVVPIGTAPSMAELSPAAVPLGTSPSNAELIPATETIGNSPPSAELSPHAGVCVTSPPMVESIPTKSGSTTSAELIPVAENETSPQLAENDTLLTSQPIGASGNSAAMTDTRTAAAGNVSLLPSMTDRDSSAAAAAVLSPSRTLEDFRPPVAAITDAAVNPPEKKSTITSGEK